MSACVGLDVGTSGVKGIALAEDGEIARAGRVGYGLSTPAPRLGRAGPRDWWSAPQEVLDALRAGAPAGIGLSGQMHGLVALDADDRVLRPAILWNDQRTAPKCEEIEERVGFERLVAPRATAR